MKIVSASHLRQLLNCNQEGLSVRITAQKLGISKSAVSHLSHVALSYGGIEKLVQLSTLSNVRLLDRFYPPNVKTQQEPDWADIHKKYARRNITLKLLYDAYKSHAIGRAYTYTSFSRRYNKPIDSLYAVGEVTGGIHGTNRLGGNAICDIFTFGRLCDIEVSKLA